MMDDIEDGHSAGYVWPSLRAAVCLRPGHGSSCGHSRQPLQRHCARVVRAKLRLTTITRRWRAVGLVGVIATVAAALAVIFYTPTSNVRVVDDSALTVEIAACGDPVTVKPGGTATLEAVHSGNADDCTVYDPHGRLLGCLSITWNEKLARVASTAPCNR